MSQLCAPHKQLLAHTISQITATQDKDVELTRDLSLLVHHFHSQHVFFKLDQQRPQLKLLHKYDTIVHYLSRMLIAGLLVRTDVMILPTFFLPQGHVVLVLEIVAACMEKASRGVFRYHHTLKYLNHLFTQSGYQWRSAPLEPPIKQRLKQCVPIVHPHCVVLSQEAALHLFLLGKQSLVVEPRKWDTQAWKTCYPDGSSCAFTTQPIKPHDKVPMTSFGEKLSRQDWEHWGLPFAFASLNEFLNNLKVHALPPSLQQPLEPLWKNSAQGFRSWEENWARRVGIKVTCVEKVRQKAVEALHASRIFTNRRRYEEEKTKNVSNGR